jgi:hypothetical protein
MKSGGRFSGRLRTFYQKEKTVNVNDIFAGDYLKVEMLKGRAVTLTMAGADLAKFDEGNKIALHFQGTDKQLALNKTNAYAIAMMYGEETGGWVGRQIEIYPDTTMFGGKMVPCIRVRAPRGMPAAQMPQQHQSYQGNPNLSPSKQAEAAADASLQQFTNQPAGQPASHDDLPDDRIPF